MIKMEYNKDDSVLIAAAGHRLDLMSELSILIGRTMHKILADCPDKELADEFVKGIFECALMERKRLDEEGNEE